MTLPDLKAEMGRAPATADAQKTLGTKQLTGLIRSRAVLTFKPGSALICQVRSAGLRPGVSEVTQICNLLYRRIAFCEAPDVRVTRVFERPADCKSAIRQIANLRYIRAGGRRSGSAAQCVPAIIAVRKSSGRCCAPGTPQVQRPYLGSK